MRTMTDDRTFLTSAPGHEPILIEGMFPASPERLFQAFTVPEDVSGWFPPKGNAAFLAEIDLQVGGKWRFILEKTDEKQVQFEGEYLVIDRPNRLDFSWRHVVEFADGQREATDSSRVSVLFLAAGAATEVKLHHEAIKTESARFNVGDGWSGCFNRLDGFVAD